MTIDVGRIDVELLGRDCAIAAYLLHLHAEHIAKLSAAGSKESEEHLENARVTHVFHAMKMAALGLCTNTFPRPWGEPRVGQHQQKGTLLMS
jgi:hypothetical protein